MPSEKAREIHERYKQEVMKKAAQTHDFLLNLATDFTRELNELNNPNFMQNHDRKPESIQLIVYEFLITYYKNRDFLYEVLMNLEKEYAEQMVQKIKERFNQ